MAVDGAPPRKTPDTLRSRRWFGPDDLRSFGHRSRLKQSGFAPADFAGKPVIAIINTWSDLSPCHAHFRIRAEEIKRGIWQAGGFPVELPAMALSETFMKPTPMLYRNLLAMEVEEYLRSQPIDGAVLMGGCDKTTPGLVMGALSADLPALYFPAGPMQKGQHAGKTLGSGSDVWKYWAERRAGRLSECEWQAMEDGIARSPGHCMTMGTASTMTAVTEAMGFSLSGASSIPATDSAHARLATRCGRRIVDMVWEDLLPSRVLDARSFHNAVTALMALGGSTNAIVHLIAMAGRAGIELPLARFDQIARRTPMLANLRPAGAHLMEDFYFAGGLRGLLSRLPAAEGLDAAGLQLGARTVSGASLGEDLAGAEVFNTDVIRDPEHALFPDGGLAVLHGNLAPRGAVMKAAAAEPRLLRHTGRALVFSSYEDLAARIDDPALDVDGDSVLVLQNAGPRGGPGFPEWGMLPIPRKLLEKGVRDMLRISDSRMSGTSYGACVLHVAPEAFIGGPLALVRTGDLVEVDVAARRLDMRVSDEELARRQAAWRAPARTAIRGYGRLWDDFVTQADRGCDFEFLHALADGSRSGEPPIH